MAERRRRQGPSRSTSATTPCAGDSKDNEVPPAHSPKKQVPPAQRKRQIEQGSAMLLYEAPSGIAIFSFDGAYLKNPVEDFWSDLPQLSLEFFLKYERVSTPFDLNNDTIDNNLAKTLTRLCGPEKKLAVSSAERNKGIIKEKLGITCLYVDVPDCEVVFCSLYNPRRTLLPEEAETYKRKCLLNGKELITFLCQHDLDVKPEMVNESIAELARLLHGIELREMEHLKFLRILLKDFMVISGIGTKNWSLIELATVLKMICYRGSSYEVYHPNDIFSRVEYRKIEGNASQYKTRFSFIDVLSVYEDVISLDSDKYILLIKLDHLVFKAKEVPGKAEVIILPTSSKVGKECSNNVDDRINSIAKGNCSEVTLVKDKLDFSCERPQDVKKILTLLDEDPSIKKPNSNKKICNKQDDQCLIPDAYQNQTENLDDFKENKQAGDTGDDRKKLTTSTPGLLVIKQNRHTGAINEKMNLCESRDGDTMKPAPRGIPDTSEIVTVSTPGLLEIQHNGHTGTIEKMNLRGNRVTGGGDTTKPPPERIPATGEIMTASAPVLLESKQNGHIGAIVKKMNLPENRDTCVHGMDGDTTKPAPQGISAPSGIAAASMPGLLESKQNGHTGIIEKINLTENRDAGVQSMNGDTTKPAPGGIPATNEMVTASTPGLLEIQHSEQTVTTEEKMNLRENRDTGVESMDGDTTEPTSSDIPNSEQLKGEHTDTSAKNSLPEVNGDDANYEDVRDDRKIPATSVTKIPEITIAGEKDASGEIPQSGRLRDLIYEEMEREANEVSSNGVASSANSQPDKSVLSSGDKRPPDKADRRSKAMKQSCMPFICCLPVH